MNDDNLDLLDLDDGTSMDEALPETTPFAAPRPRKPWLLLGVGLLVIILATYIIIRTIGGGASSSIDVDLDAPTISVNGPDAPMPDLNPAPQPVQVAQPQPTAQPAPQPEQKQPQPAPKLEADTTAGVPVRVIEDRKPVTFNPDKPITKTETKPVTKTTTAAASAKKTITTTAAKATTKTTATTAAAPKGSWYVQFGSYSTRAAAEAAQKKILAEHKSLFAGKQFVILAAVLPNGSNTYRLRVAFATSADANGFCGNAKSDGLDCYVAK